MTSENRRPNALCVNVLGTADPVVINVEGQLVSVAMLNISVTKSAPSLRARARRALPMTSKDQPTRSRSAPIPIAAMEGAAR